MYESYSIQVITDTTSAIIHAQYYGSQLQHHRRYLKQDQNVRREQKLRERPWSRRRKHTRNILEDENEVSATERHLREHQRHIHHEQPRIPQRLLSDLRASR